MHVLTDLWFADYHRLDSEWEKYTMSSTYQYRYVNVLEDGRSFNLDELKDRIFKVESELERDKKAIRKLLKSINAVHSSVVEQAKNEQILSEQLGNNAIALTTQTPIIDSLQVEISDNLHRGSKALFRGIRIDQSQYKFEFYYTI